jgi:hypothetical protein
VLRKSSHGVFYSYTRTLALSALAVVSTGCAEVTFSAPLLFPPKPQAFLRSELAVPPPAAVAPGFVSSTRKAIDKQERDFQGKHLLGEQPCFVHQSHRVRPQKRLCPALEFRLRDRPQPRNGSRPGIASCRGTAIISHPASSAHRPRRSPRALFSRAIFIIPRTRLCDISIRSLLSLTLAEPKHWYPARWN